MDCDEFLCIALRGWHCRICDVAVESTESEWKGLFQGDRGCGTHRTHSGAEREYSDDSRG